MKLQKVRRPELFKDNFAGVQFARSLQDGRVYLVIGGEVAVAVDELGTPIEPVDEWPFEKASWLQPNCPRREDLFEEWLDYLWPTPEIERLSEAEARTLVPRSLHALVQGQAHAASRPEMATLMLWLLTYSIARQPIELAEAV